MQVPRPVEEPVTDARSREPLVLTGVADGTGRAEVRSRAVPSSSSWLIDYIVVTTNGGTSTCTVYDNDESFSSLIDAAINLGSAGVAAYNPARVLASSRTLLLVWTGCTAGDRVAARIEYRELAV